MQIAQTQLDELERWINSPAPSYFSWIKLRLKVIFRLAKPIDAAMLNPKFLETYRSLALQRRDALRRWDAMNSWSAQSFDNEVNYITFSGTNTIYSITRKILDSGCSAAYAPNPNLPSIANLLLDFTHWFDHTRLDDPKLPSLKIAHSTIAQIEARAISNSIISKPHNPRSSSI